MPKGISYTGRTEGNYSREVNNSSVGNDTIEGNHPAHDDSGEWDSILYTGVPILIIILIIIIFKCLWRRRYNGHEQIRMANKSKEDKIIKL